MITFTKGKDTKFVSEGSVLIEKLKATGWTEVKPEEKEVKNAKSSKSSN